MSDIEHFLYEAEGTGDWDTQKMRGCIVQLHRKEIYMTGEQAGRFREIIERFRREMRRWRVGI